MKKIVTLLFLLLGFVISLEAGSFTVKKKICTHHHTCVSPAERKCSCGGELEFTAKAWSTRKKCTWCNGTGKVKTGEKEYGNCSVCDGTGYKVTWHAGHKCKSCGKVYQ